MELVIVLGIMISLFVIASINLTSLQNNANLSAALSTTVSDIKQQQLKAMVGDTEGRTAGDSYGIHFNSSSYVLFHGTAYSATDSANFAVPLDRGLTFSSVTVPNNNVIFNQVSGEMNGYVNGSDTVTIKNTTINQQKTLHFNRYGVIYLIN